ncbi:LCP family protein [Austwickia chelonae]|uniref:LCP family protein n=1 Tax=Austwickia chelonae TaxID=100225 RepID=UPI000E22AFE9|nr:LCP family protein [Austwickia chelonae]
MTKNDRGPSRPDNEASPGAEAAELPAAPAVRSGGSTPKSAEKSAAAARKSTKPKAVVPPPRRKPAASSPRMLPPLKRVSAVSVKSDAPAESTAEIRRLPVPDPRVSAKKVQPAKAEPPASEPPASKPAASPARPVPPARPVRPVEPAPAVEQVPDADIPADPEPTTPPAKKRRPVLRALSWVGGTALLLVLTLVGYVGFQYIRLDQGINRSKAIEELHPGEKGVTTDTNILIMGLDSRLNLKGQPLSKDIYDAMHTGNSTIGGMNTNVLMLMHIPADGRPASIIQIPRDNFVDFPGCPYKKCDGKIKEAYDVAFEGRTAELKTANMSDEDKHTEAREAGRKQEIKTVEAFLGNGLRIHHFVEVTMVAFYEIAQVVQPVQVCLKHDTKDRYSGADFKAGKQEIDAEQSIAFVRQRRDELARTGDFTDLDRERRQQAFMASLAYQLRQAGTFANPSKLSGLIEVAKRNIAVDSGLNVMDLMTKVTQVTEGKVVFYTLPVQGFFTDKYGGASNKVDLPVIQATIKQLLESGKKPAATATATSAPTSNAPKPTVSVSNGSGTSGLAAQLLNGLAGKGYQKGEAGTQAVRIKTVVEHGPGQSAAATELATLLGNGAVTAEKAGLSSTQMQVVLGAGFRIPAGLSSPASVPGVAPRPGAPTPSPSTTALAPSTVGSGDKKEDTAPGTLTALTGGIIPCVK